MLTSRRAFSSFPRILGGDDEGSGFAGHDDEGAAYPFSSVQMKRFGQSNEWDVMRRAFGVLSCVSAALAVGLLRLSFIPLLETDTVTAYQAATVQLSPPLTTGGEWVHLPEQDGFRTAYLHQPGSKVIGLRGSTVVNHHISSLLSVFLNTTRSTEWISFLDHIEEHPTGKQNKHIIYQYFNMPWPLGDREFLMERTIEVDKRQRAVTAHYTSVDDPVKPATSRIVRGETSSSIWHFKAVGNGRTLVEVESQVNPKLPVSQWVINLIQRSYQRSSMMQLLDVVKRSHPLTEYAHW